MTFKELLNSDSFEEVAPKHHNDAEIAACCIWHTSFYGYVDALSSFIDELPAKIQKACKEQRISL